MNNLSMQIAEQISECKKLMALFQTEREQLMNNNQIKKKEIVEYLKRKSILADEILKKVSFFATLANGTLDKDLDAKKKIRDLSAKLEQLLVIDTENERLVKEFFATNNADKRSIPAKRLQKKNFSLNTALPLMPNFNNSVVEPVRSAFSNNKEVTIENKDITKEQRITVKDLQVNKKTSPSRNKLKNYGSKGHLLNSFA